jgi:heat shock protein HslJ
MLCIFQNDIILELGREIDMLKLKWYLVPAILVMLALTVGACAEPAQTPPPAPQGTINVYVTDAPPREKVTSIMVTVSEIKVHRAEAEQEMEQEQSGGGNQTQEQEQEQQQTQQGEGEWISIDLSDNATTFDLLEIQGTEMFVGTREVEEGKYTQVRLVVDKVQVKLGDGDLQDAIVPSRELKIVRPFDVVAGEDTALVLDFEADKMVTVTGADKIIVKPVVKLTVRQETGGGQKNGNGTGKVTLEDKVWVLESYGEPGNLKDVLEDTEITATFDSAEEEVTGSAGCNSYFGSYEVKANKLLVPGPIGATEMWCGEQIGEQETQYLTTLQAAENYKIEDGKLTITCGNQVLIFRSE